MLASVLVLPFLPHLVAAFSWQFQNAPRQCQNVSIQLQGAGQPPYSILIVPFGPSPLANNKEVRKILNIPFNGSSANFPLNYPANSQFVAVVSDSSSFGSGGTSIAAQVLSSDNAGCYDPNAESGPDFVFNIDPPNQIVQCSPSRLWWDNSTVQGTPQFLGVIPGGQSFTIQQSPLSNVPNEGTGFSWTPSIIGGTTVIIVAGDNRSPGNGGSFFNVVSPGTSPTSSCLNGMSPSSTPGSPAGGSYPTSSTGAGTGGGGGSVDIGAIVGGTVGGLVAIAALLFFLAFLRRRDRLRSGKSPIDLVNDDEEDERPARQNELPPFYHPEPFIVPDPSAVSSSQGRQTPSQDGTRPMSMLTTTDPLTSSGFRSPTPDANGSTTTRKSAAGPRALRPINIVQHDDAGPSEADQDAEPETIELPPAYTNIRKPAQP